MALEDFSAELHTDKDCARESWSVCLHSFCDLSCVSPIVFLYLLKECYFSGTCKASVKFRILQNQVHQILNNGPQPGPATFVVRCLYIVPIFREHSEGFSHLIVSSARRFLKAGTTPSDSLKAKRLAASLFIRVREGSTYHEEIIVVKLLQIFNVGLTDIEISLCNSLPESNTSFDNARQIVEKYIFELIEAQSYMSAVSLLEQFSIPQSGEFLLFKIIESKQFKAAEKWAAYMGKPMLCLLVKDYIIRNKVKIALDVIKRHELREEFPDFYNKYRVRSLKELAEKGCWDAAEARTKSDKELLEYLVYLAMESGYTEKVVELCDRYSLEGFVKTRDPEVTVVPTRYLRLNELVSEEVAWVNELNGLKSAISHIEECKVIGLDCEWKPNYEKGSRPNKVSIIQIASERKVYIFDLIQLVEDVPEMLDNCLIRILHSPRILKLGYNFQCDMNQLASSYGDLKCFKNYEMLLDLQKVFKEFQGGLAGLSQKILGAGLNKTRRNCNWEQRPLNQNQLEYAALDAAVLIHIFAHVHDPEMIPSTEWKSHISFNTDKPKKVTVQSKKEAECTMDKNCYIT